MSVKLYGMSGSPNVRGAMLGLTEKGVDYELVNLMPPAWKTPEHRGDFLGGALSRRFARHDGDSAFLVAPATMGQRLARAKAKIRLAGIPFRTPEREDMAERLDAVLAAIYAAFAEGWSDPPGAEAKRRNLAEEAIWLGRLIAELLPNEPEVLGLLALMLYSDARRLRAVMRTASSFPSASRTHGAGTAP